MFEGVLEKLVLRLFGEYVQEFNRDQLHVSIWAGDVVLTDLKLKVGALDSFRLPIEVLHGQISTLTIKIPWTRISSAPVQITIDGLYLICGPQSSKKKGDGSSEEKVIASEEDSVKLAQKMAWTLKQRLLEQHEQLKRTSEDNEGQEEHANQSYTGRIISKIISNLQLTVKHVHFRYEDATTLSNPSTKPNPSSSSATSSSTPLVPSSKPVSSSSSSSSSTTPQAFAFGFTIGELVAQTTDSKGEVRFIGGDNSELGTVTYKLVELKAGAVYWNSQVDTLWQNLPQSERVKLMRKMELSAAASTTSGNTSMTRSQPSSDNNGFHSTNVYGYDYILHPLDINMRAVLHHGDNDTELIKNQEMEHQKEMAIKAENQAKGIQSPTTVDHHFVSTSVPTAKYFLSFTLPHLSLQLRSSQYRDAVRILDHFSQVKVNQTIALRMAKLPRFPSRTEIDTGSSRKRRQSLSQTSAPNMSRGSSVVEEPNEASITRDYSESEISSDDDSSEDEFCTPNQSPLSGPSPADSSSPVPDLDLGRTSASPISPSATTAAPSRIVRPSWCRPYWRHAIKCLILLKSRRSRLDWNQVREHAADRSRYIALWSKHYNQLPKQAALVSASNTSWLDPLSDSERHEMLQIEKKLSFESIVVFRLLAEQQWKMQQQTATSLKQAQAKANADAAKGSKGKQKKGSGADDSSSSAAAGKTTPNPNQKASGWWGLLGYKAGDAKSAANGSSASPLDTEAARFIAEVTLTPEQMRKIWESEQSLPLWFKRMQVEVRLVGADFRLTQPRLFDDADDDGTDEASLSSISGRRQEQQVEITRLTWDGSLSLVRRTKNWSAQVSVTKLEVWDCSTANTCFEKVLSSTSGAMATNSASYTNDYKSKKRDKDQSDALHPPLLSLNLEDSPRLLDSNSTADFRVALSLQPIAFVISPLYLKALLAFFQEKETTAYLWAAASNFEKNARSELLTALTDHRELDIDIQVLQPSILLPIDCLKQTSTVLVSDLQLLRMVSRAPAKSKRAHPSHAGKQQSMDDSNPNSPQVSHLLPSDIESLTHVAPSNPMAYDSFSLHFESCRLYTCASVREWELMSQKQVVTERDELFEEVQQSIKPSLLYIVDGAVHDEENVPPAAAAASPSSSSSSSASSSVPLPNRSAALHHTHSGFDVSLVMYTLIDKFERLRMKQAREKTKERERLLADLFAKGDEAAIRNLTPLPPSQPLSKILIQGSLPCLNISVCASTLEVIRSIQKQLVGLFFAARPKQNQNNASNNRASDADRDRQAVLQLSSTVNAPTSSSSTRRSSTKESKTDASTADEDSGALQVRNNLECGFIVDQLVIQILRDRVSHNAKYAAQQAAAASTSSHGKTRLDTSLFLNPHAAPIFLFHINRMGGNFSSNSNREIHSAFSLASIRILDCLQKYGPNSKFAYLACSYPPPVDESAEEAHVRGTHKRHDSNKSPPSSTDDQLQSSLSHHHRAATALARTPSPIPIVDASSHLIRIKYHYIFHPQRSDVEWEDDVVGESEETFLDSIKSPDQAGLPKQKRATTNKTGVSSFIDLDFNTLYVNWNPNTVAAVLAYLRYDETVQSDKETEQVLNAKSTSKGDHEEKKSSEIETNSISTSSSVTLTSTDSRPPSQATPASKRSKNTGTSSGKKVRIKDSKSSSSSAPAPSFLSPLAALWSAAHKNITVVTARLRKLVVTFNKEAEGRALWRLEMVHSSVEHRHVIHPSPFLFYLMTSTGTGHRSKKESKQGFISQNSLDAARKIEGGSQSPNAVVNSSGVSVTSAHLSRDPIHTFVTKGSLGNVHIYDLDSDPEKKYRELLGLRQAEVSASSSQHPPESSLSASNPVASVLDFNFAANQLEVVQRRDWCIRKRREIEWMMENDRRDAWKEAAEAVHQQYQIERSNASTSAGAKQQQPSHARFPHTPTFADTHLLLHVNSLRLVYLQQPTMEFIDYFNEGIIGATQAKLKKKSQEPPPPVNNGDKYHKLSITLSNPQVIVPRNAVSGTHLVVGLRRIRLTNTVKSRRIILGIDLEGGTIQSAELRADGSFPSTEEINSLQVITGESTITIPRPPMMELECFVTCILPQPDNLKQPQNEKYFDSITEVDARTLRGTMSWQQYVLLLNVFNENIRAPAPVRAKVKTPIDQGGLGVIHEAYPTSINAAANTTPNDSSRPSINDAPTVVYHVFDDRPPLTMDIRINLALAQVKFLCGTGYVASSSHSAGYREDALTEICIQDICYVFQKFSSNHQHMTARVHSVTMIDLRESSRAIPFKKMLCPFSQLREKTYFKSQANVSATSGTWDVQASEANDSNAPPSARSAAHSTSPPAGNTLSESEVEYIQHDYPTGQRDMQLFIHKPCGFILPDFWIDFISGFLFTANDSAFADQAKMMADWSRKQMEVNGQIDPISGNANRKPALASPRPPLSTTTGIMPNGYTPTPFTTDKRPFRCFALKLKNSRFILLEDLYSRHSRALVSTCDTSMIYASEEWKQEAAPSQLPKGQPGSWWTAFEWSRNITVNKLRMFVCNSAVNPVINAAHSVVTPLHVIWNQTFKSERRYYEPRNIIFQVQTNNGNVSQTNADASSATGVSRLHSSGSSSSLHSQGSSMSRSSSYPLLHSPMRLEVHDQHFLDVILSSASGSTDEPIELRASYQDFKLITHCFETLSEQQRTNEEEKIRIKAQQEKDKLKLEALEREKQLKEQEQQQAKQVASPHAVAPDIFPSPFTFRRPPSPFIEEGEESESPSVSGIQTPATTQSHISPTAPISDIDTFQEVAKMLNVVWKNQLTFVVINDCFQRYVPLLHARLLPGDALCVAKRKELDDEELDEDEDFEDEESEEDEDASELEAEAPKRTALEKARSFLQKLKQSNNNASQSNLQHAASTRRLRSHSVKNVVDFKTVVIKLLLEVTYFNPRVVVWEPLIEPCQIDIKCQYETPNMKNSSSYQHHSANFGSGMTSMSGNARRRMKGAVVVHSNATSTGSAMNNVPAWNICVSCNSRINVNISYVFLQHFYTTLLSWSEDLYGNASLPVVSAESGGTENVGATASGTTAPQAFSPYFIRNLTGAEILYRCRNIIRESTNQKAEESQTASTATSAVNAFAMHDRIALHSEFAADPSQFIDPLGPTVKKRVSSNSSSTASGSAPPTPSRSSTEERQQGQQASSESSNDRENAPSDGLEAVHSLSSGAEEQLSLRLITGRSNRHRRNGKDAPATTEEADYSAEDDVYRSILASRAPFSLRVRLAGGWVALNDLVINKVGTTSYVLQLDPNASLDPSINPNLAQPPQSNTNEDGGAAAVPAIVRADSVGGAVSFLSGSLNGSQANLTLPQAAGLATTGTPGQSTTSDAQSSEIVISDYFPQVDSASATPLAKMPPVPKKTPDALAAGMSTSLSIASMLTKPQAQANKGPAATVPGQRGSISAPTKPVAAALAASTSGATPGKPSAGPMLHLTQLGDRKQLLFVDVVLRDGSKVVTLRSPIELINRTNSPLCFMLHAHPTTPRRLAQTLPPRAAPFVEQDWQKSNTPFLPARDAFAIIGPVPAGGSINVPFSLMHLDFVSAMPVSQKLIDALSKKPRRPSLTRTVSAADSASHSSVLGSVAAVLDAAPPPPINDSQVGSDASDEPLFRWSDSAVSQSTLMKMVHEQSARYAAANTSVQPPGIVARLQCQKDSMNPQSEMSTASGRGDAFLLHVQAVHGSGPTSSSRIPVVGSSSKSGTAAGENLLTLSLIFSPPLVVRNLFPYGMDFRVAYTRAAPPTALMSVKDSSATASGSAGHSVTAVGSKHQVHQVAEANRTAALKDPKYLEAERKKEKVRLKQLEKEYKAKLKNPLASSMPSRFDSAHSHTGGKAKYELWGHLAAGQHIYFNHLNLDRDPYLMFRLDGFGWSERVPLAHLNPENLQSNPTTSGAASSNTASPNAASSQFTSPNTPFDYSLASYMKNMHVAKHFVTIEDNNGNPLISQLECRRSGPQSGGLELDMYVQYWLLNRTGLDLLYGSRLQTFDSESSKATIRTLPGHGSRVEISTYENQRYSLLDGWTTPFMPTDRPAWSDEAGEDRPKDWFQLPANDGSWKFEGDWRIDYGHQLAANETAGNSNQSNKKNALDATGQLDPAAFRTTDANGFEYAVDFPWSFHPQNNTLDAVRRRKWVRSYVSTRALRPLCLHSSNMRGFKEELCVRVSPLTRPQDVHIKEMHTKSGPNAPLIRIRDSDSPWSTPFSASSANDGLLQIAETQSAEVAHEIDLEQAKWKRAAAHVMALADSGQDKGKFQLQGNEEELGPLAPHVTPRYSYRRSNRYDIGVTFAPCPGIFHRTQLISFTPRFILVNQLPYTLFFRQAGAHHRGRIPVTQIEAGKFQPLWWVDIGPQPLGAEEMIRGQPNPTSADAQPATARTGGGRGAPPPNQPPKLREVSSAEFESRQVHLRKQNVEFENHAAIAFASTASCRWRWTGVFPIDEVGELSIACRSSAMTSRFVKVKVMLEGASVLVVFKEENLKRPRYRLDNATDCPMWYRQKLPYVKETREQILMSLPIPSKHSDESSSAASPEAAVSAISPPVVHHPIAKPTSASSAPGSTYESLSPWLYLGPGESTPFAWAELLADRPFLLEVLTSTHWQPGSAPSHAELQKDLERIKHAAKASGEEEHQPASHPATASAAAAAAAHPASSPSASTSKSVSNFLTSVSRPGSYLAEQAAKREAETIARARLDEAARARLGPYVVHECDTVQLDEIGYSLISMDSQTFIDVYVEEEKDISKRKKQDSSEQPSEEKEEKSDDAPASSSSSSVFSRAATKVLKLVRKRGVKEMGVAEAAAVVQMEERKRAFSNAAEERQRQLEAEAAARRAGKSVSPNAAASADPLNPNADGAQPEVPASDYVPVHKRELQEEKTHLFFEFSMPKFSLSLVDHIPRELALLSFRDLRLTYSSSNIYQKYELLLGDIQLDNQMADAMFPVVLHQKLDSARQLGEAHRNQRGILVPTRDGTGTILLPPRPFLHISCVRLTKYSSLEHYKYIGILAQEFVLKLDQSFILACIPFLDVFYNAKSKHDGLLLGEQRVECSSLEDLEREFSLPLATEEEYQEEQWGLEMVAKGTVKAPMPKAASTSPAAASSSSSSKASPAGPAVSPDLTVADLETAFEAQVNQLAHYKTLLQTMTQRLNQELAKQKEEPFLRSKSSQEKQDESNRIKLLQEEIARSKNIYHRILEANQLKSVEIQQARQKEKQLKENLGPQIQTMGTGAVNRSAAVAMTFTASPLPSTGGKAYSTRVSNLSPSWMEGAEMSLESYPSRHGNPASRKQKPYRGWVAVENPVLQTKLASMGYPNVEQVPQNSIAFSIVGGWVVANSNQNRNVVQTLTTLVNQTLLKAQSLRRDRNAQSKSKKNTTINRGGRSSSKKTGSSKHTEDDELDQIYYLENVEINSIQCVFSFFTLPSYFSMKNQGGGKSSTAAAAGTSAAGPQAQMVPTWFITLGFGSHDSNPELLSAQTQSLANAISSKTLMIANAEDAHLRLTGLHITHSFISMPELLSLLTKHYHRQLNSQLFELVGASHVLGNPIGLLSNIGTGVYDLVNEPISGAIKGPAAFGKGVAVGVGSFFKYSVRGVANTASSLIGTLGNASAALSADPEYLRRRKLGRIRQPKHLASGFVDGTRHLAKGFFDGVTGIFTSPVEGAINDGALGFMKGVGRGLIGVVVKPVTGVFDAVTTLSDGIKNTTSMFEKRVTPQRPPRILYGPDQLMRIYSVKELAASCFLDTRSQIRLAGHQRETYVDHITIEIAVNKQLSKENDLRIKNKIGAPAPNPSTALVLASSANRARSVSGAVSTTVNPLSINADVDGELDGEEELDVDEPVDEDDTDTPISSGANTPARKGSSAELPSPLVGSKPTPSSLAPPSAFLPKPALSASSSSQALVLASPTKKSAKVDIRTICFCLTDHSLVCLQLDLKGSLSASLTNSSTSSARATTIQPQSGGHISSLISQTVTSTVSKYAKVLWSTLWISLQEIERQGVSVFVSMHITPKQFAAVKKSGTVKSLFPIWFNPVGMPLSASASFSSGSSTSQKGISLMRVEVACGTEQVAERFETLLRLSHARALTESGRIAAVAARERENSAAAAMLKTQSTVKRQEVQAQIAAAQAGLDYTFPNA